MRQRSEFGLTFPCLIRQINILCRIFDSDYDLEAQYHSLLNGMRRGDAMSGVAYQFRFDRQMGSFHGPNPFRLLLLAAGAFQV